MMNRHGFFRTKVGEPAKPESQRSARFFRISQMLMRTLQRRESETLRRDGLRFAHHLAFVGPVTM